MIEILFHLKKNNSACYAIRPLIRKQHHILVQITSAHIHPTGCTLPTLQNGDESDSVRKVIETKSISVKYCCPYMRLF